MCAPRSATLEQLGLKSGNTLVCILETQDEKDTIKAIRSAAFGDNGHLIGHHRFVVRLNSSDNVEELEMNNSNRILAEEISDLSYLKRLTCNYCHFSKIPQLMCLPSLEVLVLDSW